MLRNIMQQENWKNHLNPETLQLIDIDTLKKEYQRVLAKKKKDGYPPNSAETITRKKMILLLKQKGIDNADAVYLLYHI